MNKLWTIWLEIRSLVYGDRLYLQCENLLRKKKKDQELGFRIGYAMLKLHLSTSQYSNSREYATISY